MSELKYNTEVNPETGREYGYESKTIAITDPSKGGTTTYYYKDKKGKSVRREMPGRFSTPEETASYGKMLQDIELGKPEAQAVAEQVVRTDAALKERDARAVIQTGKAKESVNEMKSILYTGKDTTKTSTNTLDVTKDPYGRFGFTPQVAFASATGSTLTVDVPKEDKLNIPKQDKGWIQSGKEVFKEDIVPIFTGAGKVVYTEAQKKTGIDFDPFPNFQASKEDYTRTGVITGLGVTAALAPPLAEAAFTYMKVGQSIEFAVNPTKKEAIRTALFFTPDVIKLGKGSVKEYKLYRDVAPSFGDVISEKPASIFKYGKTRLGNIVVQSTPDIVGKTTEVYKGAKAEVLQAKTTAQIYSRYLSTSPLEPGYIEPVAAASKTIPTPFKLDTMSLEVQSSAKGSASIYTIRPQGQLNVFGEPTGLKTTKVEEFAPKDKFAQRPKTLDKWGFEDPLRTSTGEDLRGRIKITMPEPEQTKLPSIDIISNKKASGSAKAAWLSNINKQQSEYLGNIAKESYQTKKASTRDVFNIPETSAKGEQTSIGLRADVKQQGTLDMITNKGKTKFVPPEEVTTPREPITRRPAISPGPPRTGIKEGIGNINLPGKDIFNLNTQGVGRRSDNSQDRSRKIIDDSISKNVQENVIDYRRDIISPQDTDLGKRSSQRRKQDQGFVYIQKQEFNLDKSPMPEPKYNINFKYPKPRKTNNFNIPDFDIESKPRKKKSSGKKTKTKTFRQINPSIEAAFFNIRAPRVSRSAIETGLGTVAIRMR